MLSYAPKPILQIRETFNTDSEKELIFIKFIGDTLSQTITDSELSGKQKQILWNIIRDSNILNLSFKNEKEGCCDLVYYDLVIISGNKINSLQWNSRNHDSNPTNYKTIPPVVIDLVDTITDYAKNSTVIYSQTELP